MSRTSLNYRLSIGLLLVNISIWQTANSAPRINRSLRFAHTPETYPNPDDKDFREKCGIPYLGVPYICDPMGILSQTESEFIDSYFQDSPRFIPFKWDSQSSCESPDSSSNPPYEVFLSLAKHVSWPELCNDPEDFSDLLTTSLQAYGDEFADRLRQLYNRDRCEVDLMIFCLREFSCTHRRPVTLRHSRIFLSMSDRMLDNIPPPVREKLLESIIRPAHGSHHRCFDQVVQVVQLLNGSTAQYGQDWSDYETVFTDQQQSRRSTSHSQRSLSRSIHVIPHWAIVIFVVSAVLSVCCTLLGNFVNTPAHILYCGTADAGLPSFFCRRPHNKRWKVGFGGGLFGMGNSSSNASSSGASRSQNVAPPRKSQYLFRGFSQRKGNVATSGPPRRCI